MALKALVLRKKIDERTKALNALNEKDAEFEKREAELTASVEELTEESTQEERSAVDEAVEAFDAEKSAHQEAKETLEREIGELEGELKAEEEKQENPVAPAPEEREENKNMEIRDKFNTMNVQERAAFFEREDVKGFLAEVRTSIKEKRALSNAGLLVPEIMLGMIRENVLNYSKLYSRVFVRRLSGNGRLNVMGTIPEAVWTECCANLNELDLAFNDVEVDCNKVGAFIPVCNAVLEDSDIDLASEIMTALGQAIGLALDKAILYGTGIKMPLGIVTRLAQTSKPAGYPATAREWVDLHTSNIKTISSATTGVALFQALVTDAAAAKGRYSRGSKIWVMNETTRTALIAQAMSVNAAGAVVSGVDGTMPVIGGDIIVLDFVPDNVIIGGYIDLYLLGERRSIEMERSEHVRFINDQTVFKATARYDGQPTIAEAFVAIGINSTTPDASMSFAPDDANSF